MKPRTKRAVIVVGALATLGVASALVLNAFNSNLVFFFSPTQVFANEAPRDRSFRIGGLVEEGSLQRESQGLTIRFAVTDRAHKIPVTYTGCCRTCSKRAKAWSPRASSVRTACFAPIRCWPSTTKTTCRQKRLKR